MYHRSIILILTILEVGVQPCTLKGWLWFPRRISMDTGGGHLKYMAAHFFSQIPDLPTHFSVPITLCCGCLWMAPCHSCLIFPGCHCTSADDTDANLNRRHGAVVDWWWWWWGGRMWKEKWSPAESDLAALLLCITMSISGFILETKLRETRKSFLKRLIYLLWQYLPSFLHIL